MWNSETNSEMDMISFGPTIRGAYLNLMKEQVFHHLKNLKFLVEISNIPVNNN
jgi:hypothetical protein